MAPIDLFHKLRSFYSKEAMNKPPPISAGTAAALSVTFTVLYVLPFYLSKATRPSPTLSRDAPSVIRARIRAVTSACIITTTIVVLVIINESHVTLPEALRLLGYWPIDVMAFLKTLLLCAILFMGPLFERGIVDGNWKAWIRGTRVRQTLESWTGWRNLVAGPVTEEIVFRSVLIPLHLLANIAPVKIVFVSPLYFGIAHVHHLYEFRLTHPEIPLLPAVLRSLFQFTYTSLFGFFAAFVFLRTGSLYAAIAAHSFCNWSGLPRFWGRVGIGAGVPTNRSSEKKDDGKKNVVGHPGGLRSRNDLGVAWTVAYYLLLAAGAYGFYIELFPLTQGKFALAEFKKAKGR